jgi:putative ABC transport system substrate-binding protein
MRRREFITLLGGVASFPSWALAQSTKKTPLIGFLGGTTPSLQKEWTAAFVRRLAEHGWIDGRTIAIEYRWAESRREKSYAYLDEFVNRRVDLIVAHPDEAILIAKQMTSDIPIVFPLASDPVGNGVVASLARPGGNATGLSGQRSDTSGKRVELLREIVPSMRRLGILYNRNRPNEMEEVHAAARQLGVDVLNQAFEQTTDIAPAFETLTQRADALYVVAEPLAFVNRGEISDLARLARLPTIYAVREYIQAGGLLSYGPNFSDMFRRSADFVDRILRGTKPSEIPVEQPVKFDLIINLKTARAIGLAIPETVLLRADEVIE